MNARTSARVACLVALALWSRQAPAQPVTATPKGTPLTAAQQERLQDCARVLKEVNQLLRAGKRAEALALWEKEVTLHRKAFGPSHQEVANALGTLAQLHEFREDFPAAREALRGVLAIRTKLDGGKHWRVTDARLDLEDLERRAELTAADRQRLAKANTLNEQVVRLWQAGRSQEALPLARQALAIRAELLGKGHRDYAQSLHNLAAQYQALRRFKEAEPPYQQAGDLRKRILGEAHPRHILSLLNLGELYQEMGEYGKALPLYERARDLARRALGEAHPDYARSLDNLAALYRKLGEYGKALP